MYYCAAWLHAHYNLCCWVYLLLFWGTNSTIAWVSDDINGAWVNASLCRLAACLYVCYTLCCCWSRYVLFVCCEIAFASDNVHAKIHYCNALLHAQLFAIVFIVVGVVIPTVTVDISAEFH